ncbi:MAG: hypothetical protein AAGH88_05475 [Planctomycetota bacterium]
MTDLNTRAAKAMKWKLDQEFAMWIDGNGTHTRYRHDQPWIEPGELWTPATCYNDAQAMVCEVVRRGMDGFLACRLLETGEVERGHGPELLIVQTLTLSPTQITEACCDVLENDREAQHDPAR